MVRFCDDCQNIMRKTTKNSQIVFYCTCGNSQMGDAVDTLISEGVVASEETNNSLEYFMLIKNAAFDAAGNRVKKKCPACGRGYLTMIRFGPTQAIMYVCKCGWNGDKATTI